jgi:hypothetical protein
MTGVTGFYNLIIKYIYIKGGTIAGMPVTPDMKKRNTNHKGEA